MGGRTKEQCAARSSHVPGHLLVLLVYQINLLVSTYTLSQILGSLSKWEVNELGFYTGASKNLPRMNTPKSGG